MGGLIFKAIAKNEQQFVATCSESLHQISAKRITGEEISLADACKGKKCTLVVNVATH